MFKGAIIGFGQVVEHGHVPAFNAYPGDFMIEAVADPNPKRLERAREIFPKARTYSGIKELLSVENSLDFADIATPPAMHPEHVMQTLDKGLHVMSEKPLALSLEDFEKIRGKSVPANLCVFTVHNWKKAPPMLKVREILDSGFAGQIQHAQFHVLRQKPASSAPSVKGWRQDPALSGGGILIDHGWHNFYLLCGIFGEKPHAVSASFGFPDGASSPSVLKGDRDLAEDLVLCRVDFPSGTGIVYLSWRSPVRRNFVLAHGSLGLIEVRDDDIRLESKDKPLNVVHTGEKLSAGSAHPAWMRLLLEDFLRELSDPSERGKNLAEAGLCRKLITGARQSHDLGGKAIPI